MKEILSDLTKIIAENQKEMLKLMAPVAKKQTLTVPEESDSESENVPPTVTSTPVKSKTTATTLKTTPVNSRNSDLPGTFLENNQLLSSGFVSISELSAL